MTCFYCDEKAPGMVGTQMTPTACEVCQSQMRQGILLVSTKEAFDQTIRGPWRTMVSERFLTTHIDRQSAHIAIRNRFAFLHEDAWKALRLPQDKKQLWAVAIELQSRKTEGGWIPGGIEYCHAKDAFEAHLHITTGFRPGEIRIVSAGPVIGFFVNDSQGKVLSV